MKWHSGLKKFWVGIWTHLIASRTWSNWHFICLCLFICKMRVRVVSFWKVAESYITAAQKRTSDWQTTFLNWIFIIVLVVMYCHLADFAFQLHKPSIPHKLSDLASLSVLRLPILGQASLESQGCNCYGSVGPLDIYINYSEVIISCRSWSRQMSVLWLFIMMELKSVHVLWFLCC